MADTIPSTRPTRVSKTGSLRLAPNVGDLEQFRAAFRWDAARAELQGAAETPGLNIGHLAVDRSARTHPDRVAIRWLGRSGVVRDITFDQLKNETSRFANVIARLGIAPGDVLFVLTGRIPELYVAVLGALKHRVVVSPLFSAFGPEPIRTRMEIARGRALVTTTSLYRKKIAAIRSQLPDLEFVFVARDEANSELPPGTIDLSQLMAEASDVFPIQPTRAEDRALIHFTSGTTGRPKGAVHVHEAIVAHYATGKIALDFHSEDVFWCTADPGWVTGTSYGIIAPLSHGITSIVDEGDFDAERWYRVLAEQQVSVWYTAPTAIRMMMRAGTELAQARTFPSLRFIASVGEPLNPEAVFWGEEAFGLPIHDNWWQTETGGIMVANYPAMEIRPGSMGKPLPGIETGIVRRSDGSVTACGPGENGELALRVGWPSMFRGYLNEDERYRRCFVDGWYLTGDLARRDRDGFYWFVGRADDVIKSAGHLIGPFEVESVLMEHPAVAEAAVIGKPDPVVGDIVKAFVALKVGEEESAVLRRELLGHARQRLGAAIAPKEIEIRPSLPRTRSGKIMRRLLRAQELGLPTGDLSTLESP